MCFTFIKHSKRQQTPAKEVGKLNYCTKVGVVLEHKRNEKIYGSRSYRKIGNRTTYRTTLIIKLNRFVGIRLVFLTTNEDSKYRVRSVLMYGFTTITTTTTRY